MSRRLAIVLLSVVALAVVFGASAAHAVGATLFVDTAVACDDATADSSVTPYCTIQAAIDDASAGDTIDVAAGTYADAASGCALGFTTCIDKDLTVAGAGEGVTIMDGEDARGGVRVVTDAITVTLQDLTIDRGSYGLGAGISWTSTSGTLNLIDVTVSNGTSVSVGGGLYVSAVPTNVYLTRGSFVGNTSSLGGGGVILGDDVYAEITGTVFTDNTTTGTNAYGGAIRLLADDANLTISDAHFTGNEAQCYGGSLYALGVNTLVSIDDSSFVDSATSGCTFPAGGAIYHGSTGLTITDSLFSGNHAGYSGGAIYSGSLITIRNSTFTGNISDDEGGAIFSNGGGTLSNSTVAGNTGTTSGGGIATATVPITVSNTIISGNLVGATPNDCESIVSAGYNLIGTVTGCTVTGDTTGNLTGVDPLLGALADNGGPTMTMALDPASPARDAGNPAAVGGGGSTCESLDQRGNSRAPDADCDMGAYEYYECDLLPATLVGTNAGETLTGTDGNDVILGNGGPDTIHGGLGDDTICGGNGDDTIDGGDDNDRIFGDAGADTIDGGDGIDYVRGGNGIDDLTGGTGKDRLFGDADVDTLHGGKADDRLFGGAGNDDLYGEGADDRLRGGGGTDTLDGGDGTADDCEGETETNCEI